MPTAVPFQPAWWLPGGHLQTIAGKYLYPAGHGKHRVHKQLLSLPDGDEIQLNWSEALQQHNQRPLVVLLHGLAGNQHSHYIRGMFAAFQQLNWPVVLMHFRGCGDQLNQLPRAYHSGDTADFGYLLQYLQQQLPVTPLLAVGFSLGGNVLMKYCGEQQQHNPLTAAVAVCAPLALASSAWRIDQGFSKLYQRYLLRQLKASTLQKLNRFPQFPIPLDSQQLKQIRSIEAFDNSYTAPIHGFRDAADYYQQASGKAYLANIRIPSLIIHAADDPFLATDVIPTAAELSPSIQYELSPTGGHVGFIAGHNPLRPRFWLNERIPHFFQQVMNR